MEHYVGPKLCVGDGVLHSFADGVLIGAMHDMAGPNTLLMSFSVKINVGVGVIRGAHISASRGVGTSSGLAGARARTERIGLNTGPIERLRGRNIAEKLIEDTDAASGVDKYRSAFRVERACDLLNGRQAWTSVTHDAMYCAIRVAFVLVVLL